MVIIIDIKQASSFYNQSSSFCLIAVGHMIYHMPNINNNYNKILKSDWLSVGPIGALIGQYGYM